MIDRVALLRDLKAQVRLLEEDIRQRSADVPEFAESLSLEWEEARESGRTASTYDSWLDDRVTQAAVAWALATVFIRFCEDNKLIDLPVLAGPGERLAIAAERQQEYFAEHPERTDRDWILEGAQALSVSKVAASLFDEAHNPMWTITLSHEAAKDLLAFWRRRGEDGQLIHDFTDPEWNTRFLGDLYQDLSEAARKAYALLQTPEFVEEFILDYTLDPAIEEFGLTPDPPAQRPDLPSFLRVVDPTCGSGHFLLGAFHRILAKWEEEAPDADRWEQIARALSSVHGVDKNPFAAAIARFRLLIATMNAAGEKLLARAPEFPINVAVGDSLLHGRGAPGIQAELDLLDRSGSRTHTYVTEDIEDYIKSVDILGVGSYHVVVGNPPYITVQDKQENENYRRAYTSCSGKYSEAVPFAERFFMLAVRGARDGREAGWVGQITANSFMKREFGKKLIQEFFPTVDLTYVIDTSGVRLAGFGTPPVTLIGRRRWPRQASTIRTVLGVRGEPGKVQNPANGFVWRAIVEQVDHPGSESQWVSVLDLPRDRLAKHPWSLGGGGAQDLLETINRAGGRLLKSAVDSVGITCFTLEDDLYFIPNRAARRHGIEDAWLRPIVEGEAVRDWFIEESSDVIFPYDSDYNPVNVEEHVQLLKYMWPCRTSISNSILFGRKTKIDGGLKWSEFGRLTTSKLREPRSIALAEIATHNHFVLDQDGKIFNRSAPVIKLPESATDQDYFALLGLLNSSVACFYFRQVCQPKGGSGIGRGVQDEPWEERFVFNATRVGEFPLPPQSPVGGEQLDGLARHLHATLPAKICRSGVPARGDLDAGRAEHDQVRGQLIALQEELDWRVYRMYGFLDVFSSEELIADLSDLPDLKMGERAFEIALGSQVVAGEADTQWFARHELTPITDIPVHWPGHYRTVVANRIEAIRDSADLALIERPECKRRWQPEFWEEKEQLALTSWLLDRCEDRVLWYVIDEWGREQPRPMTVSRLADRLRTKPDVVSVARLLAGADADLADVLVTITTDQHVPYLVQYRYTATGMRKRAQWEDVWDKQREEDALNKRLDIAVPPKYKQEDFDRQDYWRQRGKLDVPKERFISYPMASPDGDDSLLIGWAGWDHREQAHALMTLIDERATRDGWGVDKLTPLIAGLREVMPWVRQWYGDIDPRYGRSPAQEYDTYLEYQRVKYSLSEGDLQDWSPPAPSRRRRRGSAQGKARSADGRQQPDPGDQDEGTA